MRWRSRHQVRQAAFSHWPLVHSLPYLSSTRQWLHTQITSWKKTFRAATLFHILYGGLNCLLRSAVCSEASANHVLRQIAFYLSGYLKFSQFPSLLIHLLCSSYLSHILLCGLYVSCPYRLTFGYCCIAPWQFFVLLRWLNRICRGRNQPHWLCGFWYCSQSRGIYSLGYWPTGGDPNTQQTSQTNWPAKLLYQLLKQNIERLVLADMALWR